MRPRDWFDQYVKRIVHIVAPRYTMVALARLRKLAEHARFV